MKVAALAATFVFSAPLFAQSKPFAPKIQTPSTQDELMDGESKTPARTAPRSLPKAAPKQAPQQTAERRPDPSVEDTPEGAPAARGLRKHSLGLGLGETFLLGKYGDYGDDKITMDLFYTYAASYSFDLMVNAHWSEHEDDKERMRVRGLTGAIKSRLFEFDNFSPFVMGGLGFYAPQARREVRGDMKWSERKLAFGLNFGGGVDLRLNEEWTVGALGQFHWPFNVKQDDQTDVKGYYFKLLLTLAYTF